MDVSRRNFLKIGFNTLGIAAATSVLNSTEKSKSDLEEKVKTWDPEILGFIEQNKKIISESANKYQLPPEFLASVLYTEKLETGLIDRILDCILPFLGFDSSIGDGQIRKHTAAEADGKNYDRLSYKARHSYKEKLLGINSNIEYSAKVLRYLINRANRFPNAPLEQLEKSPDLMAIAATEYNLGTKNSEAKNAKPNYYGFKIVGNLLDDSPLHKIFGKNSNSMAQNIKKYLDGNKDSVAESLRNYEAEREKRIIRRTGGLTGGLALSLSAWYLTLRK